MWNRTRGQSKQIHQRSKTLVHTNEKRKEAWKKYTEIRDEVKDKIRPRDHAHDKALTAVKDVLADFSKRATAYKHPLIEKKEGIEISINNSCKCMNN